MPFHASPCALLASLNKISIFIVCVLYLALFAHTLGVVLDVK